MDLLLSSLMKRQRNLQVNGFNGVVSVFPNRVYHVQTTGSWDFMGFNQTVKRNATGESNVIIGVVDTGIWPELDSFSDDGFGPPPKKWKGSCKGGLYFTCTSKHISKLIGARVYISDSARDTKGTASTAAGNMVANTSFYGLVEGTARGGVPSARIAAYKVCGDSGCSAAYILAAFYDAIADGVDLLTVSLGAGASSDFYLDPIAIGAFHAAEKGILVMQSAGNFGEPELAEGAAPWMLSVAASTTDGLFIDKVVLGNGKTLTGFSVNSFSLDRKKVPLIYGHPATITCDESGARECFTGCLNKTLVKNKIVPDISTPGVNILAAYSPYAPPSSTETDERSVKYNILSGTSCLALMLLLWLHMLKHFSLIGLPQPSNLLSLLLVTFRCNTSQLLLACSSDLTIAFFSLFMIASPMDPLRNPDVEFGYGEDNIRKISGTNTTCPKNSTKMLLRNFNYPTFAAQVKPGGSFTVNFRRKVTTVGVATSTYNATIFSNSKLDIKVIRQVLSFTSLKEKKPFNVTVKGKAPVESSIESASLTWSDGIHKVRSPIVIHTYKNSPKGKSHD
ncbi:Subtilisin-like serine endopeptidase family protein, putative isoform 2 [Hibiscus syriacus]|uniref:Subtilisin-like serine endopeptidase family protein, putative isoform 2 n=1 Tax=Hibiscus syriacus TaxID=106335 RepID=A0A6A3D274_HIBSY|nr:Subtilisin-like serine endopeptidase family protein, putative isoform 2 [Hibiscus syriacus]